MIVNTQELFPEGDYEMEVSAPCEQAERGGFIFWNFYFKTELDGQETDYTESLPIWLSGPMFKALGFQEVKPGSFDVEPTEAIGRRIKTKVIHEIMASGKRAGTAIARMKDMESMQSEGPKIPKEEIPF